MFKRFTGRAKEAAPTVTVLARGLIVFNEGAIRKFALSRFNFALLFYDEELNRIGIQFTNNPHPSEKNGGRTGCACQKAA